MISLIEAAQSIDYSAIRIETDEVGTRDGVTEGETYAWHDAVGELGHVKWMCDGHKTHITMIQTEHPAPMLGIRLLKAVRQYTGCDLDPGLMTADGQRLWQGYKSRVVREGADAEVRWNDISDLPSKMFQIVPEGEEWDHGACEGDMVFDNGVITAVCSRKSSAADPKGVLSIWGFYLNDMDGKRRGGGRETLKQLRPYFRRIIAEGVDVAGEEYKFWSQMKAEGLIDKIVTEA